jgi:hypothetical protein
MTGIEEMYVHIRYCGTILKTTMRIWQTFIATRMGQHTPKSSDLLNFSRLRI